MFDLDRFKRINDNHGHQTGDKVLVALADVLNTQAGNQHIAARFGGEEFVLLMLNTNIEQAISKANIIATQIRERTIQSANHNSISVTTSIGICEYDSSYSANDMIKRADELLYLAKQSGRDCIRY